MTLSSLSNIKTTYFLPNDDLVGEVLIPALSEATEYDLMTAFFSSNALKEIAPGLSKFLNASKGNIRLIVSPFLLPNDQKAIKEGLKNTPEVLENSFKNYINKSLFEERIITKYTLECLAYLIASGRLKMKLAYVSGGDLFHAKISIIRDRSESLVIHGSTNFTLKGLSKNYENARIERSWQDQSERNTVYEFQKKFEKAWFNKENKLQVFSISKAFEQDLVRDWKPKSQPSFMEIESILNYKITSDTVITNDNIEPVIPPQQFLIPGHINCWTGEYKHQGKAIDKWVANNFRGIFEMCTGAGKTIAALVGMYKLFEQSEQLLVFISVPYRPLLYQWLNECKKFGLNPMGLIGLDRKKKLKKINNIVRQLNYKVSNIEVIIGTIDALNDKEFNSILSKVKCSSLLIGDEVHNLGTKTFLENPPEYFNYRLGLSATFERQYDSEGTAGLMDYFGNKLSTYGLSDAIGNCLVEYDYHVHPVYLTEGEIYNWGELTEKLRKLGWMEFDEEADSTIIQSLRRKRRLIIEQATDKFNVFKKVFNTNDFEKMKYTLIYTSDKGRDQLEQINEYLMEECGILFHQVTSEETSTGISQIILDKFASGNSIQALTAMRVLDEGINIPEISKAYLLASTTVKRQWTQRRGRLLRKCDRINKTKSEIHDFIVVSPVKEPLFEEVQSYEFDRIREFAKLSLNPMSETGGITFIGKFGGF